MARLSRFQLNAIVRASVVSSILTNLQAGRMGLNAGKQVSNYWSRQYIDWTKRCFGKFLVPTTATPVALDGSGNPSASYEFILTSNPQTNDLGVYNCWIPGQISGGGGGGLGIAKSSATTTTVVNFSSPVYTAGDNTTRFTMTVVSGGGTLGVVVSNPTASGYLRILPATINGSAVTEAQSDDFHPDAITQMGLGTTIRALDWVLVNQSTETDWTGSLAAGGDGSIRAKIQGLGEFLRFTKACGNANPWINIVPLATDAYITQFVTSADTNAAAGATINVEWADENWNTSFTAYDLLTQAACVLAGSFAGNSTAFPAAANTIKSCTRDGAGTATAVITGAPRNGNGSHVSVNGITNITGGWVVLTAVVNNGDGTYSISWAEAGGAVTGTVVNSSHNYNSYIHTDVESGAVHYLLKPLTTYGPAPAANTFVSPYVMKGRYVVERLRTTWTAIQSLPGKGRFRICLNNKFGAGTGDGLSENEAYPYAFERFGDHSWLYTVSSAPYFSSESATTTAASSAAVLTAIEHTGGLALDAFPQLLIREGNAAYTWGHAKAYYEGGPGLTNIGSAGAFIGAAEIDPGMGTLITRLLTMMRDSGQTGPFCYYGGGSTATFGSASNTMWPLAQGGAVGDLTQPKPAALLAWGAASSVAAPIDGVTSGTINIPFVWFSYYGSSDVNGCRTAGPTAILIDPVIQVTKTIAGNYPISVWMCSSNAADWVSIFINGVEVAHQTPLTLQNPTIAAPSTAVWTSASYPMNAGTNLVKIVVQPTGRLGTVGYNQIVSPDTPV